MRVLAGMVCGSANTGSIRLLRVACAPACWGGGGAFLAPVQVTGPSAGLRSFAVCENTAGFFEQIGLLPFLPAFSALSLVSFTQSVELLVDFALITVLIPQEVG